MIASDCHLITIWLLMTPIVIWLLFNYYSIVIWYWLLSDYYLILIANDLKLLFDFCLIVVLSILVVIWFSLTVILLLFDNDCQWYQLLSDCRMITMWYSLLFNCCLIYYYLLEIWFFNWLYLFKTNVAVWSMKLYASIYCSSCLCICDFRKGC